VEKLAEMFWAEDAVIRFGVTENLYGQRELQRLGRATAGLPMTEKRLARNDFAGVTLEFEP